MTDATDAATVTTVRKALIAESNEHYMNAKRYFPKLKAGQDPTQADFDAAEGRAAAAAYSYLLAVILREAPSRMGEKAASDLATLIDAVQQDGMLAIEEANGDLEEIVYAESLALGVRVRVSRPGASNFDKTGTIAARAPYSEPSKVGVAIDGREGVQVYAAYDVSALAADDDDNEPPDHLTTPGCFTCGTVFAFTGPKSQQQGTTNCRECAGRGRAMSTLTWRDLNFGDEVVLLDGTQARVMGVRECKYHAPAGDAQLRFATDADDADPLWYAVESLRRASAEAVDAR